MKKCLIIENSFKDGALSLGGEIAAYLAKCGVECTVFEYDGSSMRDKNVSLSFDGYNFIITLGGDGTVLFACRGCAPLGIPVLAVNLGEFGFLASVQVSCWKEELKSYLEGSAYVSERSLIEAEVLRDGKTVFKTNCMNDIVISGSSTSTLINLEVAYNHALLGPFKVTGVIVATPTGSTGYNAGAGGPIVDSTMEAMLLTTISSFSLSARPLVFGADGEIAITVLPSRIGVELTADGQRSFSLEQGDVIILGLTDYKARLLCSTQEKFYAALQSKLNWAGGPRA